MHFRSWLGALALAVSPFLLVACGGDDGGAPASGTPASVGTLAVVSNRADLVSGGDALVELVPEAGVDPAGLKLDIDGADVTQAFALRPDGRFMGLVTGLKNGANVVSAKGADGSASSITITNHGSAGAILYGPQIQPWACDAGASDTACSRPVTYSYRYVSSNPALSGFLPYDPSHPATDVASTTNDAGVSVPYIVRIETGVQDRDYYDIAVLFDPARPWTRWTPQTGWNRKLLIVHGSGCGNAFSQSNVLSSARVLDPTALARGFAVLAISLNDSGHNCNIAVQAEATMMAKEHLVEAYGDVRYTFGFGSSGGALAQQWMANAYPGLYNGIIVAASFPDAGSTMLEVEDCALLKNYFGSTTTPWTDAQQAAASGHLNTAVCNEWINVYGFNNNLNPYATNLNSLPGVSPTALGGCDVPASAKYDATFNPAGARCTLADLAASIFGKRADGIANRPWSNVGVQYGLAALQAGTISTGQFVDLNARIGSHTLDYDYQPRRVDTSADAVAAAYRSGWANQANGMGQVAILDMRGTDITGIHHQYRSWVMRARLDRANGGHANQAIWYQAGSQAEAYTVMDAWLAAIEADKGSAPLAQKIVTNRPASANDRCGAVDGTGLTMAQCTGVSDGSTRMAAGAGFADDVIDCVLKPLDRAAYGNLVFTDSDWARMQETFPTGVCDYSKPGNGQQPTQLWQTYLGADGSVIIGGQPLPAAP